MMFTHRLDDDTELRLLEREQADELFALVDDNREYLRQWLPWVDDTKSVEDSAAFIEMTLEQFAEGNGFQAGVWYEGALGGVIGHHGVDRANLSTSLGYWLGASFQGKGLMTKSCRVLIEHAFGYWGLERVEIRCATENMKSRAIPERLGFELEGVLRRAEVLYGTHVDLAVYGMVAAEWNGGVHGDDGGVSVESIGDGR